MNLEILGFVAGICTSAASIPQIVKVIKEKQADNVSPWMFVVLLIGNALWSYYGINKSDLPIIVTNVLAVGLDITMLFLKRKYSN